MVPALHTDMRFTGYMQVHAAGIYLCCCQGFTRALTWKVKIVLWDFLYSKLKRKCFQQMTIFMVAILINLDFDIFKPPSASTIEGLEYLTSSFRAGLLANNEP